MLAMDRNVFASEGRGDMGEAVAGIGTDRFRISLSLLAMSSARSCAADTEGLSFRGVIGPISAVISSPLVDGPADAYCDPFCDLLSVDVVP